MTSPAYAERVATLAASLRDGGTQAVRLAKPTSNLFRDRAPGPAQRLDVRVFDHVLEFDTMRGWMDVEGMTTYERAVEAALREGVMPSVVPELKTITVGGAVAGVGIEATSFRHGLVHETMLELDVLTADGTIRTCTPDNEHADLFHAFPNSYGTLGYALRVRMRTQPVHPYVRVTRERHAEPRAFFEAIGRHASSDADFLDAVVFEPDEMIINIGRFVDTVPAASDYTWQHIYYRSIREKPVDYLTTHDYLWRWDTDWFWCSRNMYAQVPWVRALYGQKRLNSRTYSKIMALNARLGLTRRLDRLRGLHGESIIQDVDIPIECAPDFLEFYWRHIDLKPLWICPTRPRSAGFTLFPMDPSVLYVNFGFWDVKRTREPQERGHFNRLVERKVIELGGIKSLYSESFFTRREFEAAYAGEAYRAVKAKYDPGGRFRTLYEKCVENR